MITRNITHNGCDLHNNPQRIQFANGNVTKYVYSAAGEKLRAIHYTAVANTHVEMGQVYADIEKRYLAVDSTDYRLGGNAVFNNGSFSKVLFDGGYVELVAVDMPGSGYNMPIVKPWKPPFGGRWTGDLGGGKKGPTVYSLQFRYFNRGHLGNVREMVSKPGEVKQVNAYYPFGTPIHALGTNESQQLYKYNGKEFGEFHGLNTYDYGARQYDAALGRWTRIDGGYITFADSTATSAPTFHYYVKDYLGNNRLVVRDDGFGEQMNHYYPFGALMSASTQGAAQRYKYNGKELDRIHGLNLYDYGARQYDAALGRWTSIDPLAEKYYEISPYAYCLGNPINHVDYEGSKVVTVLYVDDGAVPTCYYQSPKHFADGMRILARTEFGRKILADFTPKGSYIFGVKGNGKYADFKLRIQEDQFVEHLERRSIFHKHDGTWIQAQTTLQEGNDGKPEFRILFDINYSLEELIETIIHEFALHLSKYEKVISAYKRNGSYKDAEEEWNRSPEKIEHHDLIDGKRGKRLPGTINYEKTKGEVIKNYPNLKEIFEDEMHGYERRY